MFESEKPKTIWFTMDYNPKKGLIPGLKLPKDATLCQYGEGSVNFFPECSSTSCSTFWADTPKAAELFNILTRACLPGVIIDIPHSVQLPEVQWGDLVYCFTTRRLYQEQDGFPVCTFSVIKLIVG